jgi:hypothetical protein
MEDYTPEKLPIAKFACPICGAKSPTWSYHDTYKRYLVAYENQNTISYLIEITRVACSSCKHTHALLPEIIIPYSSYGLMFVLSVLKDYFSKMKIKDICSKYQISATLIYDWKLLFLQHKRLWFGILEDMYQDALNFLSSLPNGRTSNDLQLFFSQNNYSFLQGISKKARFNSS